MLRTGSIIHRTALLAVASTHTNVALGTRRDVDLRLLGHTLGAACDTVTGHLGLALGSSQGVSTPASLLHSACKVGHTQEEPFANWQGRCSVTMDDTWATPEALHTILQQHAQHTTAGCTTSELWCAGGSIHQGSADLLAGKHTVVQVIGLAKHTLSSAAQLT